MKFLLNKPATRIKELTHREIVFAPATGTLMDQHDLRTFEESFVHNLICE